MKKITLSLWALIASCLAASASWITIASQGSQGPTNFTLTVTSLAQRSVYPTFLYRDRLSISVSNGVASFWLNAGSNNVAFPSGDNFNINVPNDSNTYNILDLTTNVAGYIPSAFYVAATNGLASGLSLANPTLLAGTAFYLDDGQGGNTGIGYEGAMSFWDDYSGAFYFGNGRGAYDGDVYAGHFHGDGTGLVSLNWNFATALPLSLLPTPVVTNGGSATLAVVTVRTNVSFTNGVAIFTGPPAPAFLASNGSLYLSTNGAFYVRSNNTWNLH